MVATGAVHLDPSLIDEIADRLVDRLVDAVAERVAEAVNPSGTAPRTRRATAWLDASEVAERLGAIASGSTNTPTSLASLGSAAALGPASASRPMCSIAGPAHQMARSSNVPGRPPG